MKEIGALEAKTELDELLDLVEAGEDVLITRRGKAVARLTPAAPATPGHRGQDAAKALRRHRQAVTLGDLDLKDLIHEGRK